MHRLHLLIAVLLAAPLPAQKPDKDALRIDSVLAAPRPRLPATADSNDLEDYVAYGHERMRARRPVEAAVAFLWAARLSPAQAEPPVLAWRAIWTAFPGALKKHTKADGRFVASGAGQRVDSLFLRGMQRNPFVLAEDERERAMRPYMMMGARGAIARDSDAIGPRVFLAVGFFHQARYDSTIAAIEGALRVLDRRQDARTRPMYESREIFYYALGHAHSAKGDQVSARDAYRRALEENAGFYHAHARLGFLAWDNWRDSATALLEYQAAVTTAPQDAALRNDFGAVLLDMGRPADALEQFEAGLAVAPEYSLLHYNAAMAADKLGRRDAAIARYEEFARRGPMRLKEKVEEARERARWLGTTAK